MNIPRREFLAIGGGVAAAAISGTIPDRTAAAQAVQTRTASPKLLPDGAVSRFAQVNGIQLHYVMAGSGPPVVLLHGWPQTWFAWCDTMQALSSRFRVIAPDLRGTGLSERTAAGYDKRTIATDIRDLIKNVAGPRAHVVAHDMGGKAAFVMAKLYPEVVDRLILVDCLIPGTEITDALNGGAWHYGFHMAPEVPEMLTRGRERSYIAAQIRNWSFRKDAVSSTAIDEFSRHYATAGGMTAGFNYYRALRTDAEMVNSLKDKRLEMPVLAIGGQHGVGSNLASALRPQAENLQEAIAENSGHFVAEEAPEFFQESVIRFLHVA